MAMLLFEPLFDSNSLLWPELQRLEREMGAIDSTNNEEFKYTCNFQGYRPNEISVQHEGDHIMLEANHKHKTRHEHFERSLKRVIKLPEDVDKNSVRCEINEKGELVVRAQKVAIEQPQKRSIPISFKKSEK